MYKNKNLLDPKSELSFLSKRAFSIIELVEVSGIQDSSFKIIRTKLLNLGNDINRLDEKYNISEK